MFTALKTGDEEQIKQYINIEDVIEEASDEFIKWWKEERNTTKKRVK